MLDVKINESIEKIISALTLEEKCDMCHGGGLFRTGSVIRLRIPPMFFSDGPMGVRKEYLNDRWEDVGLTDDYATYLPSNSALAATWNTVLAAHEGEVLGCEARGRGKDVILAPGINIMRNPLCGRNYEYMSEDPYLVSELVVPFIRGIQQNDVSACVKHFIMNDQETNRFEVSAQIDDRALFEIYLPGFKAAVLKGGVYTIMGAYNKFRGVHCCENAYLLKDILRTKWNFDGVTVSDWGGIHKTKTAAENGCDIEMNTTSNFDNYCFAAPLIEAVKNGQIQESVIDNKIRNILKLMYRLKKFDSDRQPGAYNVPQHRTIAYNVALESFVLLKNEGNLLPLPAKKVKKVAVIGMNANSQHSGGGDSAQIKALYEITPLAGIKMRLGGNVDVAYFEGYSTDPDACEQLRDEAIAAAAQADFVLLVGGLDHNYDTEGKDRENLKLPYNQDELIKCVLGANSKTAVVIICGCAVDMSAWIDKAPAVIHGFYSGMEGGTALASILCGDISPSGKLPFTIPRSYQGSPLGHFDDFLGDGNQTIHRDGIFVGYRFYDKFGVAPLFPFGHGLSYTTFEYESFSLHQSYRNGELHVTASVKIINTGLVEGAEIVQLYVGAISSAVSRPPLELKGFQKVNLKPKKYVVLQFELNKTAFSYFDAIEKCWVCECGSYQISVGASSRNLKQINVISLENEIRYDDCNE